MLLSVSLATFLSLYRIYNVSEQYVLGSLKDVAEDEASTIETLTDLHYSEADILKILQESKLKHQSIGSSGEIVIAKRDDSNIIFLLRLKKDGSLSNLPMHKSEEIATPIKLALAGKKGSIKSKDYVEENVLAGYTYVKSLKWGIVAKINQEEVNAPFYKSAIFTISIVSLILVCCTTIFIRINYRLFHDKWKMENKFHTLFNGIADAVFFADMKGNIIEVNDNACERLQYTREEILNMSITDIDSKEEVSEHTFANLNIILEKGEHTFETYHQDKFGNSIPVEVHATKVTFGDEEFVLGITRDISDRKRMIDSINAEKQRLFVTLHSIGDAVIATDLYGKITLINPVAESLTGWSQDDAIGMPVETVFNIINQNTREKCINPVDIVITQGIKVGLANSTALISRTGREFIIADSGSPIWDNNGVIIGAILVFRDITEQHRLQEQIRENEEKFRLFLEHSPVYVFFKDDQFKAVQLSKNYELLIGRPVQEMIGKDMFDLYPPSIAQEMWEEDQLLLSNGKTLVINKEFNGRHYTSIKFIVYRENKSPYLAGFTIDNTEQYLAEQKLKQSEEKFAKSFKLSPDSININRLHDGVYLEVNGGFTAITGFSESDVIGKSSLDPTIDIWVDPNDRKRLVAEITEKGEVNSFEAEFRRKDGAIVQGIMSARIIELNGERCMLNITKDVTEQKKADLELRETQEELDSFFNLSVDLLCIADMKGHFKRVNKAWETTLGYKSEELLSVRFTNFIHTDDLDKTMFAIKELESNNSVYNFTNRCRNTKGEYLWLEWQAIPVNNMIFAVVRDITFRKLAEETLQESERRLFTLMSNLPGMAYRCKNNFNWTMEFVSEGCVPLTGYSSDSFINDHELSYTDVILPQYRKYVWEIVTDALDKHQPFELNYQIKTAFGEIKWVWERGSGVYSKDGEVIVIEGFIWDITEIKKFQEELIENQELLQQQNEKYIKLYEELEKNYEIINRINDELKHAKSKAEESDKLKSAFLANMSHEIRTPMNAILGFSKLLGSTSISESEKIEFVDLIHRRGHDLLNLINDILDISKIEADQIYLHYSQMEINEILFETRNSFIGMDDGKLADNVDLRIGKIIESGCYVISDPARLRQVINNLIGNAIKFTDDGHIEVGYEVIENDYILFYVEDTGIGIHPEHLEIIFDRFRQADENFIARNFGGSGLGLSISKALVEKMGGKIWAESSPGSGSTFYFTLPYMPVLDPEISKTKSINSDYDWSDKSILIVEDDIDSSKFLVKLITSTGANITLVENGKSAIEVADKQSTIDLILIDIQLPDISGYKVIEKIREKKAKLPILAQTAYASDDDKHKALEAGCNDFISKPIDHVEFYRKIQVLLNKNP